VLPTLTTVLIEVGDLAAAERTCAAGLAGARGAGDLASGRYADAALRLREALQTTLRTGVRRKVLEDLDCCGYLCALTGRSAEAVTVWAAVLALGREGFSVPLHPELPEGWFQRQEPLREARQALGPSQAQSAEERGQAMSLATAAEYVLMLTAAGLQPPAAAPGLEVLSPRERELVTLVARGTPMRRSPASCPSACARSARTWTASAIRPDAGDAPTSPDWPSAPAWSNAALVLRSLPNRSAASPRGGVGDFPPAMAARQEGRNDPCRGPGGLGEPMAEGRKTGQSLADRTRQ
jgi:hypothetical protein